MKVIQITILSRNRWDFLQKTIQSALGQKTNKFHIKVRVSDNSDSTSIFNSIKLKYPNLDVVKRVPVMSSSEHMRVAMEEVSGDYVVFMHDDDIMLPEYAHKLATALEDNVNASAVSCNSISFKTNKSFLYKKLSSVSPFDIRFKTSKEFFGRYLRFKMVAPYCGYMYRSSLVSVEFLNGKDYKYADVSLVSEYLNYGEILWLKDILILSRLHDNNDSNLESLRDRRALRSYMYSVGSIYNLPKEYRPTIIKTLYSLVIKNDKYLSNNNRVNIIKYYYYRYVYLRRNITRLKMVINFMLGNFYWFYMRCKKYI